MKVAIPVAPTYAPNPMAYRPDTTYYSGDKYDSTYGAYYSGKTGIYTPGVYNDPNADIK